MKHLLLISLLAVPLNSNAMFTTTKEDKIKSLENKWERTLERSIQAFKSGTLTQEYVLQDVINASWRDDNAFYRLALQKKAAIIAAVQAIIAKGAAATPQELENAKAGLMFLKSGLAGYDLGEIESLQSRL